MPKNLQENKKKISNIQRMAQSRRELVKISKISILMYRDSQKNL